jgi:hypothetical protein
MYFSTEVQTFWRNLRPLGFSVEKTILLKAADSSVRVGDLLAFRQKYLHVLPPIF